MIEFLKHATGMCGEPHPNLFWLIVFAPIVSYTIATIKNNTKK